MATFWPGCTVQLKSWITVLSGGVAEAHMVKGDLSVNIGGVGAVGGVCQLLFFRLVQEFEHPLGGSGHALQHIGHLRKLLDGLGKVFDVLDKGLNITNGDNPVCGKKCCPR